MLLDQEATEAFKSKWTFKAFNQLKNIKTTDKAEVNEMFLKVYSFGRILDTSVT